MARVNLRAAFMSGLSSTVTAQQVFTQPGRRSGRVRPVGRRAPPDAGRGRGLAGRGPRAGTPQCADLLRRGWDGEPAMSAEIRERVISGGQGLPLYLDLSVSHCAALLARGGQRSVADFGGSFTAVATRSIGPGTRQPSPTRRAGPGNCSTWCPTPSNWSSSGPPRRWPTPWPTTSALPGPQRETPGTLRTGSPTGAATTWRTWPISSSACSPVTTKVLVAHDPSSMRAPVRPAATPTGFPSRPPGSTAPSPPRSTCLPSAGWTAPSRRWAAGQRW